MKNQTFILLSITAIISIVSIFAHANDANETWEYDFNEISIHAMDDKYIYATVSNGTFDIPSIAVIDISTGKIVKIVKFPEKEFRYSNVELVIVDENLYALPDLENGDIFYIFDKNSLNVIKQISLNADAISFHIDEDLIYFGTWDDNNIYILNKNTGEIKGKLEGHADIVKELNSDRGRIYSTSDDTLKVWDKNNLSKVASINDHGAIELDGENIYVRSASRLNIYDKNTFEKIKTISNLGGGPYYVAIDKNYIYANFIDKTHIFDKKNFKLIRTISSNGDTWENIPISNSAILLNDDKIFVEYNNKIRVWNKETVFGSDNKYSPRDNFDVKKEIERNPSELSPNESINYINLNPLRILFFILSFFMAILISITVAAFLFSKSIRNKILVNSIDKLKWILISLISIFGLTNTYVISNYDYFSPFSFIFLGGIISPALIIFGIFKNKRWAAIAGIPLFIIWILLYILLLLQGNEFTNFYKGLLIFNIVMIVLSILWAKEKSKK